MNKKLLLRRPRHCLSIITEDKDKIDETDNIISRFKSDIESEIAALEREYSLSMDEDLFENREMFENKLQHQNTIFNPIKNTQGSVVSLCNLDVGLQPIRGKMLPEKLEKFIKSDTSSKTVSKFEKLENPSKNAKSVISNQNIFNQIEQKLPLQNKSIPKHILIIQLAALLKYQLSEDTDRNVSCAVRSLPKSEHYLFNWNSAPKYEIVLYETDETRDLKAITAHKISDILQRDLMNANVDDTHRSVINEETDQEITPTKVSMMECWMTGKTRLNLAAHSISTLPNLMAFFPSLNILDLSYNNFKMIPDEIYELYQLHSLNLKNNPLQILDDSISKLSSLRVLICSYTLISSLPSSLFRCDNLEQLDLSYNNINCVPHIDGSCKLKVLNLSGNPIRYFKKSFAKLNLESLGLEDTWIHPVFWQEGEFALSNHDNSSSLFCDLCDQIIKDFSFNFMAYTRRFNHVLPILMSFCSALCRDSF